ncbi:MAG: alpha/beta hydrolase, partial [Halobacteriota archaeon]
HGRGATARGILQLVAHADPSDDSVAYLAPQAIGSTWYPRPFMVPTEANEPHLTSALATVGRTFDRAADGVDTDRVVFIGFSQGACLASEYVARNPRRYAGLFAFSGGLIGETVDPENYRGSLEGMPVYLGCSDVDPHIPAERVHETADAFERLGASVTAELFEGMGHQVNETEIGHLRDHLASLVDAE